MKIKPKQYVTNGLGECFYVLEVVGGSLHLEDVFSGNTCTTPAVGWKRCAKPKTFKQERNALIKRFAWKHEYVLIQPADLDLFAKELIYLHRKHGDRIYL